MQLREDSVAVRVPATTANLGPGFDAVGMGLDLWDEVSVRAVVGQSSVTVHGEGADTVDTGEGNLVVRALRAGLDRVGAPQVGVRMRCINRIPHGRGLGSSASAIVAGLALARALVGDPEVLTAADIIAIGSELEGHPDNVAPAVLGGATLAWPADDGRRAGAVRLEPPAHINPVAFVPDFELSTSAARSALPGTVPFADAVHNVARSTLLAGLLGGAGTLTGASFHEALMEATEDRLHQEYRRSVMEPSLALVDWLREAGLAAVVSGAGPTVLSLEAVPADIREQARGAGWTVLTLPVARTGVEITRGQLAGVVSEV